MHFAHCCKQSIKKEIDAVHSAYAAAATKALAAAKPVVDPETEKTRQELDDRVASLAAILAGFKDEGVLLDVVAWNDGTVWRAAIGGKVAECNVTWYGALTCHVMVIVCLYGATCNVMLWGSAKQGRVGQGARPTQLIMAQAMHLDPRRWRCSQCFRRA